MASLEAMNLHSDAEHPGTAPPSTTHLIPDTVISTAESSAGSVLENGQAINISGGNDSLRKPKDEGVPKAEADKPRIMYRVVYRYYDGEIAHEKEGHDKANLLAGRLTPVNAHPPITVTTVFQSNTFKERSNRGKRNKTDGKRGEKGKETTDHQNGTLSEEEEDTDLEQFTSSRASLEYMTIHSRKLINALRDVITYYPGPSGINLLLSDEFEVYEPYQLLYHHMKDLRRFKEYQPPWHNDEYRSECNQHLDILLDFLDHRFGKTLQDEEARWTRTTPVCTFEFLWLLLKPGEACYYVDEDEINPYITQEVDPEADKLRRTIRYTIDAWNIDFDGTQVGRCMKRFFIPPFDGEKEIRSLKFYPIRFFSEAQESIEKHGGKTFYETLVERGRKFWALAKSGISYQEYNGVSAGHPHKKVSGIPRYISRATT